MRMGQSGIRSGFSVYINQVPSGLKLHLPFLKAEGYSLQLSGNTATLKLSDLSERSRPAQEQGRAELSSWREDLF